MVSKEMGNRGLAKNWVYGLPHAARVLDHIEKMITFCSIEPDMACDLRIAARTHDVARNEENHQELSALYFRSIDIPELSAERKSDIAYAIANHSSGLTREGVGRAVERKHILTGFLALADHLDDLSYIGQFKVIESQRDNEQIMGILSENISAHQLREILKKREITSDIEEMNLKKDSVVAHMIYNYVATGQIKSHIEHFLGVKAEEIVKTILSETLLIINKMLRLQEQVESSSSVRNTH